MIPVHTAGGVEGAVQVQGDGLQLVDTSPLQGEKAAQWQTSLHMFAQMSQLQLSPDEICLGALVSACDKGGAWHLALHSLRGFARFRLGHDIITWNSAISACERRRRWPQALALVEGGGGDGVTAACSACGKGGLWERALSLSQSLPQADTVLHNTLVFACVRGTAVAQAVRLAGASDAVDLLLAMYETLEDTASCLHLLQGLRRAAAESLKTSAGTSARMGIDVPADWAMAFVNCPIKLLDLIRTYEISKPPWEPNQTVNFLMNVTHFEDDSAVKIHGLMKSPELKDVRYMTWHTEKTPIYCSSDPVTILTDERYRSFADLTEVFCHQGRVDSTDPYTITLTSDTLLIPWCSKRFDMHATTWAIEQYSGGYGGWKFAYNFLMKNFPIHCKTIGIEAFLPFATQYSLNHSCNLIGDAESMPFGFLAKLNQSSVLVTQIQNLDWQKQLQILPTSLWTISSPCQSWSTASSQEGFGSPNGLVLGHSIGQLRIFKPPIVALEQVAGFESHPQHALATRLMTWAGYLLVFKSVYDLSHVTPCRRARWLAVYIHHEFLPRLQERQMIEFPWPYIHCTTRSFDAILQMTNQDCTQFEPSVQDASRYFQSDFMPGQLKQWTKKQILDYRIPSLDGKQPTFMAKYGHQHELRPYQLNSKGLFGHFLRQGIAFRFWSPIEIALLHGQSEPILLLKPPKLSWEALGNCIAIPHATFILGHAMNLLFDLKCDPSDLVRNLIGERLTISNTITHQDFFAWYIGSKSMLPRIVQRLHFFMNKLGWTHDADHNVWPPGAFFSPEEGILPMQVVVEEIDQVSPTDLPQADPNPTSTRIGPQTSSKGTYRTTTLTALKAGTQEGGHEAEVMPCHTETVSETTQFPAQTNASSEGTAPEDPKIAIHPLVQPALETVQSEPAQHEDDIPKQHSQHADTSRHTHTDCIPTTIPDSDEEHGPIWTPQHASHVDALHDTHDVTTDAGSPRILEVKESKEETFTIATTVTPFLVPGEYGTLRVHADVHLITLLQVWNQELFPNFHVSPEQMHMTLSELQMPQELVLLPHHATPNHPLDIMQTTPLGRTPVFHRTSTDLTLYEIDTGSNWKTIKQKLPALRTAKSEIFGDLQDHAIFKTTTEFQDHHSVPPHVQMTIELFQQLEQVRFETVVPPNTDILVLHCQGSQQARHAFMTFWLTSDHAEWYASVGRQCCYQSIDDTTWRILFRPQLPQTAMPVPLFREALQFRLWQTAFLSMSSIRGHEVLVKHYNKTICRTNFDPQLPVEVFLKALFHVQQLFPLRGQPSLLSMSKRCTEPATMQDLFARLKNPGVIVIHVAHPMTGGGGPIKNPTSKQDVHRMIQAGIAKKFLTYGLDLPVVTTYTAKLMDYAGNQRLQHLLQAEGQEADHSFAQLCAAAQIELPPLGPTLHLTEGKFKRIKTAKQNKANRTIDINHYQLEPGFFVNSDGTESTILQSFSWHSSGVALVTPQFASDLFATITDTTTDELAIYVVGNIHVPDNFPVHTINAPATDAEQRRVLLNGKLIQLGQKHISPLDQPEAKITTNSVQVTAVTLWKSDFDEQMWTRLQAAPVRTTRDLLALDGFHDLLGKPWGRAYRAKGVPVEANQADSIQFHAEFPKTPRYHALLKRSGFNRVYLTPKTDEGQPDPSWRVIWLQHPASVIESKSATLSGTAGLVRGMKGTKGLGLRVEAGNYTLAWTKLRPDHEQPDERQLPLSYKLQPLPTGTDKHVLQEWSKQQQWPIRPLKPVGAKQWLVAAAGPPPKMLLFNTQPLLVQEVTNKQPSATAAIAAGPRPKASAKPTRGDQAAIFKTGDPFMDPWTKPTTAGPDKGPPSGAPAASTRAVEGPVADKFQQQDVRIQAIEAAVGQLQTAQQQHSTHPAIICGDLNHHPTQLEAYQILHNLGYQSAEDLHMQITGLTLDLVKCFNTLPQSPIYALLTAMGVPEALTLCWQHSLSKVVRHWDLHMQLFATPVATTGFPEGDSLSVAAMVAVNQFWCHFLLQIVDKCHAFADNWAYATTSAEHHRPALAALNRITQSMSLRIDWEKTWGWATNSGHKEALQHAKLDILQDETPLQIVNHARELGYILHYRQVPFRGTQKERHQQALKRLKKLQYLEYPIADKSHMVLSSGLAKALCGVHMYLCGEKYFRELRTAIARALVGDHHNVQPHIACSCLSKKICDPEFVTIVQAVKAARAFLLTAEAETRRMFFSLAAVSNLHASQIVGPAKALHAYLGKLGWTITRDGILHTDGLHQLHVLHSNWEDVHAAMESSWMTHVALMVSNRKGLTCLPTPNRMRTYKALNKMPTCMQPVIALEMTAGYMLNTQKQKFAEQQSETCDFCGQDDSREHRLLHCPATQAAREPHHEAIQFLQQYDEVHMHLPLAYLDPEIDFYRLVLINTPWPDVFQPPTTPKWFLTDGSCSLPTHAETRWASFAVVYPHVALESLSHAQLQDLPWLLDNAFSVATASHVRGPQTMPRAELSAAVLAQELGCEVPIVSDSQYAIDCHELIMNTPDAISLHKHTNYDLLARLHAVFWDRGCQIPTLKVKAHQLLDPSHPDFYMRIGNAVADLAAKRTQDELMTSITQPLRRLTSELVYMTLMLDKQLQLRSDLAQFRQRLQQDEVQYFTYEEKQQHLLDWELSDYIQYPIPEDIYYIVHASRWGTPHTANLLDWLQTLKWPREQDPNTPPMGISWVELALNFMVVTRRSIPVNVGTQGTVEYKCSDEDATFDAGAFDFTSLVNSFRGSIEHAQYLTQLTLLPTLSACKTKSIHILGAGYSKMGIPYRPQMLLQVETLETLMTYLQTEQQAGRPLFRNHPKVAQLEPLVRSSIQTPEMNSIKRRQSLYHQRRLEIKRSRQ
eukprot:s63_g30.t1